MKVSVPCDTHYSLTRGRQLKAYCSTCSVPAGDWLSEPQGATVGIRSHQVRYGPGCIGEYLITTHCVEAKAMNGVAMARKSRIASSRERCCDE